MFGETLVFGRLLEEAPTPESRLGAARREHRGLDRDRLPPGGDEPLRAPRPHARGARRASWRSSASASCGPSRRRSCSATPSRSPRATARWWSYIPHFISTPGYVYAYAYGQLLALSVYARYEEEGDGLRARATSSCSSAGGSMPPGGARADRRHRPRRPGLLGPRARPRRAPARGRRAGGARGRPDPIQASASASSFVTVFQLRAVAVTPSLSSPSSLASGERWIPSACQA